MNPNPKSISSNEYKKKIKQLKADFENKLNAHPNLTKSLNEISKKWAKERALLKQSKAYKDARHKRAVNRARYRKWKQGIDLPSQVKKDMNLAGMDRPKMLQRLSNLMKEEREKKN